MSETPAMYRSAIVVLILQIYVVFIGPVDANCDTNESPCICVTLDTGTTAINCSAVFPKLTEIPKVPHDTTIFDLSNNRIRPDALHELCEYTRLEEVSISRNHLKTIPAKELMRCLITRSLNLSGNVFDAISHDSLKGLETTPAIYGLESMKFTDLTISSMVQLRLLDLIVHQTEIPNTLFNKLRLQSLYLDIRSATELPVRFLDPIAATLERLQLTSNVLDTLQESLLYKSQTLAELYLQLPALRSVPTNFFQTPSLTSKLKTIVLKGIKSLPRNVFSSLNGLRSLDVHEAEDLPSGLFSGLRYLETLDLTGTHLVTIPTDWFTDLGNLRRLVLRSTGLQSISKTDFSNMNQLRHVDLSKNEIRKVPSHFFREISETVSVIDLSYNNLKMISYDLFNGHSSLKKLYLNDNKISSIQPGAFVSLSELRELYLQNNKLYPVEETLFANTRNITHLDLSSNILTSLPADNVISYLDESIQLNSSSLHKFDVMHNKLLCNCSTWRLKFSLSGARVIDCQRITPTSMAPSVADNGVFQLTSSD
ncbi:LRIG3-like protein, partial [Mya arenaria]